VTSRGLSTDVDEPDDLRLLLREPGLGQRTGALIESVGFSAAISR
jgi:hypothetical protein